MDGIQMAMSAVCGASEGFMIRSILRFLQLKSMSVGSHKDVVPGSL